MNAADCYFEECAEHKLLSPDEEKNLLIKAKSGDQQALDELVSKNQRLVLKIARRYETYGGDQELMDLIQYGNMGMMEAIRQFDIGRKHRFSTYAVHWIRAYVRRYALVRGNRVSLSYTQSENRVKVGYAVGELLKTNEREPTSAEVAEFSGLSLEVSAEIMGMINRPVISLDDIQAGIGDEIIDLRNTDDTPEEQGETLSTAMLLRAHVGQLPAREQYIICHHYGIDGTEILTLDEIGRELGLSRTRVRQIEEEAIKKLSQSLNSASVDGLTV